MHTQYRSQIKQTTQILYSDNSDAFQICNKYCKTDYAETPTLFMEFHGGSGQVDDQLKTVSEIAQDHGGSNFKFATLEEERSKIWQARHNMHWALKAIRPGWDTYATDICVPISKLPEIVDFSERLFNALGMQGDKL